MHRQSNAQFFQTSALQNFSTIALSNPNYMKWSQITYLEVRHIARNKEAVKSKVHGFLRQSVYIAYIFRVQSQKNVSASTLCTFRKSNVCCNFVKHLPSKNSIDLQYRQCGSLCITNSSTLVGWDNETFINRVKSHSKFSKFPNTRWTLPISSLRDSVKDQAYFGIEVKWIKMHYSSLNLLHGVLLWSIRLSQSEKWQQ